MAARAKRLEFTKAVKLEIFRRAGGPDNVRCEGPCGLPLGGKPFELDHALECWEMEDVEHGYRAPLTAADGQLLCIPCHDAKTGKKAGERAKVIRRLEKAAGIERGGRKPKSRFRKKMNGDVVDRDTGEIIRRGSR